MTGNIHDKHLIDRYLQGELSGIELESFNERMTADESFKKEVGLKETIYAGIYLAKEQQLQKQIIQSINYRRPSVPYALKLIILFFAITATIVSFWFYVGN